MMRTKIDHRESGCRTLRAESSSRTDDARSNKSLSN